MRIKTPYLMGSSCDDLRSSVLQQIMGWFCLSLAAFEVTRLSLGFWKSHSTVGILRLCTRCRTDSSSIQRRSLTCFHHRSQSSYSSSLLIITSHHQFSSSLLIITSHHHFSSSVLIISSHHHFSPPLLTTTSHHHFSPSLLTITSHHHFSSSFPFAILRHGYI